MMRWLAVSCLILGALGCGDDADPPATDAGTDAAGFDAGPEIEQWPRELPDVSELGGARRGRDLARTIVHLHSPLSHDACDGEGWVDGGLADPDCLDQLRDALCTLRVDAAMLTDHTPHLDEVELAEASWPRDGDERITDGDGNTYATRWTCPDGHQTLVTVGSENRLMPIGLHRHPGPSENIDDILATYEGDGAAVSDAYREAGGLSFIAHTEEKALDYLREQSLDGLEIYNLHGMLDPRSRLENLQLEDATYISQLLWFTDRRRPMPADLVFVPVNERSPTYFDRWDTLLSEGMRLTGVAGTDAHRNAFPDNLSDGERMDSYRRVIRWFSNHLLVDGDHPDDIKDALANGRLYVAFEIYGPPVGFDFFAESGTDTFEMGQEAPMGTTLRVTRPTLPAGFPADPAPTFRMQVLRSQAGGAVEVATTDSETLEFTPDTEGSYRVEVHITPEHMRPFLGDRSDVLIREAVWIYSNPIHIAP